ncbi:MAG: glycine cleavage system protein T [Gammaproteobacteria bacterium RIFCSPHIGHO2_12_FULL_41_15]|nr:MAG: glycine cleavage system protein T [Gammaproteobacteria bacterium RIFCSPHIGHO2_12_FULL_41_15]
MSMHTSLYQLHLHENAKMTNFFGWEMPLSYGSSIQEHNAVRNDVGCFDVSHMTILDILGAGGRQFLRKLLTNDVDRLPHPGAALYTCMCNEHGGIIDDLIVYQRSPDSYRLILNAGTKDKDLAWIEDKSQGFAVGLQTRPDLSIIAVQGPNVFAKLPAILNPAQHDAISTLKRFECVEIEQYFFARTGYTGEDGLEIILPHFLATSFWQQCLKAGIKPCGLAARDSLRLEAGYMLYGQDMDESNTPLESGLSFTIKWKPQDRDFIGMGALLSQKDHLKQKMVGLILNDKAIMRANQKVIIPNQPDGIITSGGYSPTLEKSIALARVPFETKSTAKVEIRDKLFDVTITSPRFIESN